MLFNSSRVDINIKSIYIFTEKKKIANTPNI